MSYDGQPGTILLIDSNAGGNQLFPTLQLKKYRFLLQKKYGKTAGVYVCSNGL
jgi:hypothetical protein